MNKLIDIMIFVFVFLIAINITMFIFLCSFKDSKTIGTDWKINLNESSTLKIAEFRITAYTSSKEECTKWFDGFTSAMIRVKDLKGSPLGIAAVDKEIIPFGSYILVPGKGPYLACDTGNGIKGYEIDLLMDSKEEARKWGVKEMEVLVIMQRKKIK